MIARARPGVVDTSALPMDIVSNPGTMNAIINFARRPLNEHEVEKWRNASICEPGADPETCWCEPGRDGKCWEKSLRTEPVLHVLKGGEDSIGINEAIQRVNSNIGSFAEQCWINHVVDLRAVDPEQRNHGQTPFDVGQCRRDCSAFQAIEDRHDDVKDFFPTARPTDLWQARGLASPRELEITLEAEFHDGAFAEGREIFAATCARCHFEPGAALRDGGLPCHESRRPDAAARLDGRRRGAAPRPKSGPTWRGRCTPTMRRAGSGPSTRRSRRKTAPPTRCARR